MSFRLTISREEFFTREYKNTANHKAMPMTTSFGQGSVSSSEPLEAPFLSSPRSACDALFESIVLLGFSAMAWESLSFDLIAETVSDSRELRVETMTNSEMMPLWTCSVVQKQWNDIPKDCRRICIRKSNYYTHGEIPDVCCRKP
jgi:hypothetical protein